MTQPTSSPDDPAAPTTEAGRALLFDPDEGYPEGLEEAMGRDATRWRDNLRVHILAIEAEARDAARREVDLDSVHASLMDAMNRIAASRVCENDEYKRGWIDALGAVSNELSRLATSQEAVPE